MKDEVCHRPASAETTSPTVALETDEPPQRQGEVQSATVLGVLIALSVSHLLNDTMQSLIPAIYPVLKTSFNLSFTQIGLITLANQLTASLLQPLVGWYTDRKPQPFSLAIGMGFTLAGLGLLSVAGNFEMVLVSVALVGVGSSVFHPEASRVARMASGGRHGFAQSLFQVGGNAGTSFGPLLAALIIVPGGQREIKWFCLIALAGIVLLQRVGAWYVANPMRLPGKAHATAKSATLPATRVRFCIAVLIALVFSKYIYLASMTSYYMFFLIHKFGLSVQVAQVDLFIFLFAVAAGTIIGGPVGDRIGRKRVIWASILGVAPFTLLLPHVPLAGVVALSIVIGMILASAFSAIVVYAQELIPGKVGMIAGLFFGLAFGLAGLGSAALGKLADLTSLTFVFDFCSFLPLLGVLAVFLPDLE
ncbi:MAG: MFS transporter [Methylacidiphilales bacterium]|nr:MFS transporter [Candidatus Methylacidiphilales bacterium]